MTINQETLKETFKAIETRLNTLNFESIWPGFKRFPFALYNDTIACFSTGCVSKPDTFMANTAVRHQDQWHAIWYLQDTRDLNRLTALIVHEMFHAYQHVSSETRFPDEMEAVFTVQCDATYLDLKQEEQQALVHAWRQQDIASFKTMLAWRKARAQAYPKQTHYESQVEVIEGTAHYVELRALKQLDPEAYTKQIESIQDVLLDPKRCLPIRPMAYLVGAFLLATIDRLNLTFDKRITPNQTSYTEMLFAQFKTEPMPRTPQAICETVLSNHQATVKTKINAIINDPEWVQEGTFTLRGCNIYDAQFIAPHLYTTYFVMLEENGESVVKQGTFVCEMADRTVVKLYKRKNE